MTEQSAPPPESIPADSGASAPYVQLTQVRVPLDEAGDAFGVPDASGRLPIVILPSAPYRIRNSLVIAGVVAAIIGAILDLQFVVRGGLLIAGILLVVLGVFRAFLVPVPEGSRAILLKRGRIDRTIGPGNHIIPPWIAVSHLVTTREIPFDVPVTEVPTQEGLRVSIEVLLTFGIVRPEQFVYAISAPDFDQVCQAAGQDALRMLIRGTSAEHVLDLAGSESAQLAETTARLEAANKALETSVLVSREAMERSGLDWWRPMGRVRLRGRSTPVDLFEPAPDFATADRARLSAALAVFDTEDAEKRATGLADLKAVFFVKDFAGDPEYTEWKRFVEPRLGQQVALKFQDGEVMVGARLPLSTSEGFLLFPADRGSNNEKVFVVNGAITVVEQLPE